MSELVSEWHYQTIRKAFAVGVNAILPKTSLDESSVELGKEWGGDLKFRAKAKEGDATFTGEITVCWHPDWNHRCSVRVLTYKLSPRTAECVDGSLKDVYMVDLEYARLKGLPAPGSR
ncbi:MAG: hypothetical protein JWL80_574 [Parcubacteria group bacterium]|nr:hypothetical protein [Parcubacteria group bacterium]